MKSTCVGVCLGILVTAGFAQAEFGVEYISTSNTAEVSLMILPDGSGPPLAAASLFGGQVTDATVELRIADEFGTGLADFPAEDLWLDDGNGQAVGCGFSGAFLYADGPTDANGVASFSGSPAGGGTANGTVYVYLSGGRATEIGLFGVEHPPLNLRLNSPDLNADGKVDLSDLPTFATDFYGTYNYRSDFVWDGVVNLTDVVKMAGALGHDCP